MKKRIIFSVCLFLITILLSISFFFVNFESTNTLAKDNGYTITNYDVSIVVDENKTLSIREDITVDFTETSHGIYRYIPLKQNVSYVGKDDKIQSRKYGCEVSDVSFITNETSTTYKTRILNSFEEEGNLVLMLGTRSYDLLGEKTFSISYKYSLGDDRDVIEDSFYFNIIGNGWNTSIDKVNFSVKFPTDVSAQTFKFYVGEYGKSTTNGDSRLTTNVSGNTVTGTCVNLKYTEAITMFTLFEQGYFKVDKNTTLDVVMVISTVATLAIFAGLYIKRKEKSPVVEVVEFSAPDDLTPTEVGFLNDGEVTGDDLSALIIYWASKGYLRIEEKEKKTSIIKIKDLPDSAKKHEKILFKGIFDLGDEVDSKDLRKIDPEVGIKCKLSVEKNKEKYFDNKLRSSKILMGGLIALLTCFQAVKTTIQSFETGIKEFILGGSVLLAVVNFIYIFTSTIDYKHKLKKWQFNTLLALSVVIMILPHIVLLFAIEPYCDVFMTRFYLFIIPVCFMFVYPKLNRYTEEGRNYVGRIRGLKNYIMLAEKDKLEMLVKDNPELFYQVLPYAYVLGVSDVYIEKFKDIPIVEPSWYTTDADVVSVWWHVSLLNSTMNGISNIITSSMIAKNASNIASSVLSGISNGGGHGGGGGFSGGGFGGGGGGRF